MNDVAKKVKLKSDLESEVKNFENNSNRFRSKLYGTDPDDDGKQNNQNKVLKGGTSSEPRIQMSNDEVKFVSAENVNIDQLHEQLVNLLNDLANKYQQRENSTYT